MLQCVLPTHRQGLLKIDPPVIGGGTAGFDKPCVHCAQRGGLAPCEWAHKNRGMGAWQSL
jgi:hypothetical protein